MQPIFSTLKFIHGYARLNLFMERDLSQDVTECIIRLKYRESSLVTEEELEKSRNLTSQLSSIEKLDGRVCVLPFDVVATMEGSRSYMKSTLTGLLLLLPYIVLINRVSYLYLCLNDKQ